MKQTNKQCILRFCVYSSTRRPRNAYMSQYTRPLLVEIMACRLLGAKPSSELILDYCQLDTCEHDNLHNGIYCVSGSKCSTFCFQLRLLHIHDDVIKWKHFPRYWPFVQGIHRWPVNSPHKGQWRGALMFSLISARINSWVNNRETEDLRRHHAHHDVTVMIVVSVFIMYTPLYIIHQVELLFLLIESP